MNSAGYQSLNNHFRGFSGDPVVRGPGLIPDPGAKILQAMWHSQKTKQNSHCGLQCAQGLRLCQLST